MQKYPGRARTRRSPGPLPLAARAPPIEGAVLPLKAWPHVPAHELAGADARSVRIVRGHSDLVDEALDHPAPASLVQRALFQGQETRA